MVVRSLIRMANDTAAAMLGYETKQRMLGHNVNVLVPPPFAKVVSCMLGQMPISPGCAFCMPSLQLEECQACVQTMKRVRGFSGHQLPVPIVLW
jgi:hypothetical protein